MTTPLIIAIGSGASSAISVAIAFLSFRKANQKDSTKDIEEQIALKLKVEHLEDQIHDLEHNQFKEMKEEIKGLRADFQGFYQVFTQSLVDLKKGG